MTGGRQPPGNFGDHVQHGGQFAHELRGAVAVRLVDHEDIGDLHDSGLDRLDLVAHPRDEDDDDRMGVVDDLHLLLPGPHGLHHDDLFPHDIHDMDGVADGLGEAAQGAAGGEAADEDAGVFGVALHPDPVAQDRAAGEGGGRIDGQDADRLLLFPEGGDQGVDEGALARPGGAGDPDDVGAAGVGENALYRGFRFGEAVLEVADQPGGGPDVPGPDLAELFCLFRCFCPCVYFRGLMFVRTQSTIASSLAPGVKIALMPAS